MTDVIAAPDPQLAINLSEHRKPGGQRALWPLFGWGGVACLALAAVAFVSQTQVGAKRLRSAFASVGETAPVIANLAPRAPASDGESKRLAAQLREIAADRDRLAGRVAALERTLADMTGSIQRQGEQIAAVRATAKPQPSAPATLPATASTAPTPVAKPAPAKADLPWFMEVRTPQAVAMIEEPTATAAPAAPSPPTRVASATAAAPREAPAQTSPIEIGVDLGGASTIQALREHWAGLKANYGPLLVGLNPRIAEYKHPSGVIYRLVVGPLPSSEEATQFCARFPTLRTGCHPAKYFGVQLAAH